MHARFAFPPPSLADRLFLQASRSCSVREQRRCCTWSEEISLEDSPLPRTWKPRTLSRSRTTETPSTESTNTSPIEDCSHTRTRKHQTGNRLHNRGNLNALLDEHCFLSRGFRDGGPFTPNASPIGDRSHTQTRKHRTGKCLPNHENIDSLLDECGFLDSGKGFRGQQKSTIHVRSRSRTSHTRDCGNRLKNPNCGNLYGGRRAHPQAWMSMVSSIPVSLTMIEEVSLSGSLDRGSAFSFSSLFDDYSPRLIQDDITLLIVERCILESFLTASNQLQHV